MQQEGSMMESPEVLAFRFAHLKDSPTDFLGNVVGARPCDAG